MSTKVKINFKRIILCLLLLSVSLCAVFICSLNKIKTSALSGVDFELFLPQTDLELQSLNAPSEVYSDDDITVIIEDTSSPNLLIHKDGKTERISATQLTGIKRLNKDTLIFTSEARLKKIDLSNFSNELPTPEILDSNFTDKAVSHFDFNGKYIVTAHETFSVYEVENNTVTKLTNELDIYLKSPIAINKNNQIFFVTDQGELRTINVDNLSGESRLLATVSPSTIIADNDYVYYVNNNKIYRLSVNGGSPDELTTVENTFDLGKFNNVSGISLSNGNLFVCDATLNTVQEFRVDGNNLVFTGYAIASGKSAYNRVSSGATDIEKYGSTVAVLDGNKITVINTDTDNQYDSSNFKKIDVSDIDKFALGDGKILTANNSKNISIIDLNDPTKNKSLSNFPSDVKDVCYQSGKFYILGYPDATHSSVYSIDQVDENYAVTEIKFGLSHDYKFLTVDVFGNLYLSDTTKVDKFERSNAYQDAVKVCDDISDVKKLSTDLSGTLYLLDGSNLKYYDGEIIKTVNTSTPSEKTIKSFAMDFIGNKVYTLHDDGEFISVTNGLENLSLEDIALTDKYVTTAPSAEFESLKFYKPKDGANVYSIVNDENGIAFSSLITERNEYAYICDLTIQNEFNSVTFFALVGQTERVLINSNEVISIEVVKADSVPNTAYTTTGVNMYYLPIITKDMEYSLTNANGTIRLDKGYEIKPEQRITFLDCEYYFASAEIEGQTVKGYIPTAFTVEVLSEDFKWNEYSFIILKTASLYEDKEMTVKLFDVEDGQRVKLISTDGDVACVALENDGEWTTCYVDTKYIKNEPSLAVRNALIIIAVAACVCATSAYFVLKRRD